jgi:hypothetical protein
MPEGRGPYGITVGDIWLVSLAGAGRPRLLLLGVPAVGPGDAPRGRGPYGITGTPEGDIWFVPLAGPRPCPSFSYSDAMRGKGARVRLGCPASVVVWLFPPELDRLLGQRDRALPCATSGVRSHRGSSLSDCSTCRAITFTVATPVGNAAAPSP